MQALHVPVVSSDNSPPYSFPSYPPPPSVLQFSHSFPLPTPPSERNEPYYLLTVHYTALTRSELAWSETLEPARFHPYGGAIPGHDVVGAVKEVFLSTTATTARFKAGDLVWGLLSFSRDGAASTHTIAAESELALLPPGPAATTPDKWQEMLATLPLSGLTAYQALQMCAKGVLPEPGGGKGRILVAGATGSVGILTIQLAAAMQHDVVALASERKLSFLKETIGVGEVICYDEAGYVGVSEEMIRRGIEEVDVVVDCVGGDTLAGILARKGTVRKQGKVITIAKPAEGAEFFIVEPSADQMDRLAKLVWEGKLVGYVDSVYPLSQGREAMEKVESRKGAMGKVVLKVLP